MALGASSSGFDVRPHGRITPDGEACRGDDHGGAEHGRDVGHLGEEHVAEDDGEDQPRELKRRQRGGLADLGGAGEEPLGQRRDAADKRRSAHSLGFGGTHQRTAGPK